jgi:hypothetical protein
MFLHLLLKVQYLRGMKVYFRTKEHWFRLNIRPICRWFAIPVIGMLWTRIRIGSGFKDFEDPEFESGSRGKKSNFYWKFINTTKLLVQYIWLLILILKTCKKFVFKSYVVDTDPHRIRIQWLCVSGSGYTNAGSLFGLKSIRIHNRGNRRSWFWNYSYFQCPT